MIYGIGVDVTDLARIQAAQENWRIINNSMVGERWSIYPVAFRLRSPTQKLLGQGWVKLPCKMWKF